MRDVLLTVLSAGAFWQCLNSASLPPNPCPNLFQYLQHKNGVAYGRVTLENDYSGHYNFSVNMSIAAYLVGEKSMETKMESTTNDIVEGRPLVYNISFPIQSVIPRLTRIQLNNKVYCFGSPEELGPSGVTEMFAAMNYGIDLPSKRPPAKPERKLQSDITSHTQQPPTLDLTAFSWDWQQPLTTPIPPARLPSWLLRRDSTYPTTSPSLSSRPWKPSSTASTTDTPLPRRTLWPFLTASTTSAPLSSKTSTHSTRPLQMLDWLSRRPSAAATTGSSLTEDFSLSDEECGLSTVNTQELAVDGNDFVDGQFPWLVAILYRKDFDYNYKCTGSLVSNRHVITAGHCVRRNKEIESYLLVFGKKKVQNWVLGAIQRELQNITVHPDYNDNKKDADIAILTVTKEIEFEAGIKPVCLWHGEKYVNRMAGMQGTVVGWWTNGRKRTIDAKKIDLPIVSQMECLRSSPSVSSVVSSRTFCAGLKGSGPCHGDSGAGFAMQKNGRWTLRGVVFTSVGDLESCDVENYFVFVDIDKVMSWLKEVMT